MMAGIIHTTGIRRLLWLGDQRPPLKNWEEHLVEDHARLLSSVRYTTFVTGVCSYRPTWARRRTLARARLSAHNQNDSHEQQFHSSLRKSYALRAFNFAGKSGEARRKDTPSPPWGLREHRGRILFTL